MTTTLINPVTAEAFTEVPSADLADTDAAIERAQEAFLTWRSVAPGERARLLRAFAARVDAHSRSSPGSRSRTPATRSATPAGRRATYATA